MFDVTLHGSAGPCHGHIFDGSLLHWEKAHVFSAFGFVHKIATFEKSAGFQALVQFSDLDTASSARSALDGRSIPRYLLAEHVGPCHLRISFSAHTDLNVKFQSHRSRDYTNPNLPVAPSAIDGTGQFGIGPDGQRREPESNVLLASIENMLYAVTVDVLHTVFSAFGTVQKIAMFEKNAGWQALIQYADIPTAVVAKEALEGHSIYDGGYCKLHLSYSRHTDLNVKVNNDRSRDYTLPKGGVLQNQLPLIGQQLSSLPAGFGGQPPSAPYMYPGNHFVSGLHPPQPASIAGPVSQTTGSLIQGTAPNQIYMTSPAQLATSLGTSSGFPGQAQLSVPPYSSATYFSGPTPMQNPGHYTSPMGSGMPPLASQNPHGSTAFPMPAYRQQPMHMQTPVGRVPASASSTYYI